MTAGLRYDDMQYDYTNTFNGGAAGATVQARIRGTVRATALLEGGTAVLTIAPTAAELASDARLELRYVNGSRLGTPASTRLSDLF